MLILARLQEGLWGENCVRFVMVFLSVQANTRIVTLPTSKP
jgi:hypothetical protein